VEHVAASLQVGDPGRIRDGQHLDAGEIRCAQSASAAPPDCAKLVAFPPAVMEACIDAALELYHEVSEVNPDFKRIYKAMTDFHGDQYLWWQVAEYSNDTLNDP
jgi:TRAP-type mannitol/chloroaromatic compound transport system substrate-binding protein